METENPTLLQQLNQSVLVKLFIISVLIILLLIPSSWIQSLITEREGAENVMRQDVSANWSGAQFIQGPVLAIPYKKSNAQDSKGHAVNTTGILYVLPENLNIK